MSNKDITDNHEVWTICKNCGTEFDARVTLGYCPECGSSSVKNNKKRGKTRYLGRSKVKQLNH